MWKVIVKKSGENENAALLARATEGRWGREGRGKWEEDRWGGRARGSPAAFLYWILIQSPPHSCCHLSFPHMVGFENNGRFVRGNCQATNVVLFALTDQAQTTLGEAPATSNVRCRVRGPYIHARIWSRGSITYFVKTANNSSAPMAQRQLEIRTAHDIFVCHLKRMSEPLLDHPNDISLPDG
jgi:hypothetical protein